MHAKDLVIDEGCNWHAVEHVLELLPDTDTVSPLALIVEAIDPVDLSTLMITAQQEEILFELRFIGKEQDNSFE